MHIQEQGQQNIHILLQTQFSIIFHLFSINFYSFKLSLILLKHKLIQIYKAILILDLQLYLTNLKRVNWTYQLFHFKIHSLNSLWCLKTFPYILIIGQYWFDFQMKNIPAKNSFRYLILNTNLYYIYQAFFSLPS